MSCSSRRPQLVSLLTAKNRKLNLQIKRAPQNWTTEDLKNAPWSDSRVRIWQHHNMKA